ncbi:epimerase family protein sdr39u1 homolog chloroplastic [Phtheirospermum japonicum]|uniref:Epimerase family protein sdr39u1 homolog chloroplastic n=1 Tax=Phtheirospermum japonicum TaxID=374723 RepID=A0A830DM79_9LAMI|nr:epimerase family protein sdr39u1 homolog chloroplastic [Phtheirospermum japonicum]
MTWFHLNPTLYIYIYIYIYVILKYTWGVSRTKLSWLIPSLDRVWVLTRSRSKALSNFPVKDYPRIVIAEEAEWRNCIQGSTVVVNLAGLPISTRWSPETKKEIKNSKIRVTSKVVDLIDGSQDKLGPKVLTSATAVGYYGTSKTRVFDEQSPSGNDYLAEVCREWEVAALSVNKDIRVALIRIGVVLGKEGGALAKMIPLFMMFAGGPLGQAIVD